MGVSSPSYFINHIIKNKKNMKNLIIVPFDLNTARKIKSWEIEGSVLIDNIEIEFVYESKDCAGPYNLLFVRKDGYGISAIYANTEGCTIGGTTLELKVEAGAYFKKGDVLTSTNGYQFIYDGIITKGIMGCICGMATFGDIRFDYNLWTHEDMDAELLVLDQLFDVEWIIDHILEIMTWKELKDKISLMTEEEQRQEVAVWGENMNLMKDCSLEKTDEDMYYNSEWDYTCEESELEPEDKNDPDVHKVYEAGMYYIYSNWF